MTIDREIDLLYMQFVKQEQTLYSPEHGSPFAICTLACQWISQSLSDVKILGYWSDDNPTATVGVSEGGHDFVILNDRYLLDFWYKLTYEPEHPVYLDIHTDRELITQLYGEPKTWMNVPTGAPSLPA